MNLSLAHRKPQSVLLITDLGNSHVEVSWQRGDEASLKHPHPIRIVNPLTAKDRNQLRWYLEEYRGFPFGAEKQRAAEVERNMADWGASLFEQIFLQSSSNESPVEPYQRAIDEGSACCDLCVSSNDTTVLSIPWELMRDSQGTYLHHLFAGFYRQRTRLQTLPDIRKSGNKPLRVLLVIARPDEEYDVKLWTVARPVLKALRPLGPRVQLEVLRPATFERFTETLWRHVGYYDLVHFDGHGGTDGNGLGCLLFENAKGNQPELITSLQLGQSLAKSSTPFFVLNACRSADEGSTADPYSSVASQLIGSGAAGVVAMSYTVYADTASIFMGQFYESLVGGRTFAEAVSDGRRALYEEPSRQSVVGALDVHDWIVPILYQQTSARRMILEARPVDETETKHRSTLLLATQKVCPEGEFGFIGRDDYILKIERAFQDDARPWVLLTGPGGTGKTELANGFARWWVETGEGADGVFATSFKGKAQFSQIVGSVVGYGTDFSRLTTDQQFQELLNHLRSRRCLLIWDNFESVHGYPDGVNSLASAEDRDYLAQFLAQLEGSKSRVILTTRHAEERWLGLHYQRLFVRGLQDEDKWKLADVILKTKNTGRVPEDFKDKPDYARLLRLLNGHPRSMELILPLLKSTSPTAIINAIDDRATKDSINWEDASLRFAFERLSWAANRYLPFVGLFSCYVQIKLLANLGGADEHLNPTFLDHYKELAEMEFGSWQLILNEAAQYGFIRNLEGEVYEIDPLVSSFLHDKLRERLLSSDFEKLINGYLREYFLWLADYRGVFTDDIRRPLATAEREEANLLRAQRLAEDHGSFVFAGVMVESLNKYYGALGRYQEWQGLIRSSLQRLGYDLVPKPKPGQLTAKELYWEVLTTEEAAIATVSYDLDAAEKCNLQLLEFQLACGPGREEFVAQTCLHLGDIAWKRRRLEDAEKWFLRGVQTLRGINKGNADLYLSLGRLAQELARNDQAEQWYRKALDEGSNNEVFLFRELESIALAKGLKDVAEHWHEKATEALEIMQGTSYEGRDFAAGLSNKAELAARQKHYGEAEAYYRQALEIFEQLQLDEEKALVYHNLGRTLEELNRFDEAIQWYEAAGELFTRLGLSHAKISFDSLRGLHFKLGRNDEALEWLYRVIDVLEKLGPSKELAERYYSAYECLQALRQLEKALPFLIKSRQTVQQLSGDQDAPPAYIDEAQNHEIAAGTAALEGRTDDAFQYYQRAFEIYHANLSYKPTISVAGQLVYLSGERGSAVDATAYLGKAVILSRESQIGPFQQAVPLLTELITQVPEDALKARWNVLFNEDLPPWLLSLKN